MAQPLPVTVYGPITPLSPAVRTTGSLPGAQVIILADGAPIGDVVTAAGGELWVPLTSQPNPGQRVTAIQKTPDGESEPAVQSVQVVDVPDPLPVPVIFSELNTCMVDIWAGALVPGATVVTKIGAQQIGSFVTTQPNSFLNIDPTTPIQSGARIHVQQHATVGGVLRTSNPLLSLPVPQFTPRDAPLPTPILGELTECITSRPMLKVTAGASLSLANEGQAESWINPSSTYQGEGGPPLRKGTATAKETMPRCEIQGPETPLPVAAAGPPPAPTITQDLCPQVMRLTASGLTSGATLHVWRRVLHDPAGTSWSQASVGDLTVSSSTQPVDLPPSLNLTDPTGTVVLALWQTSCGGDSPSTVVKVAAPAGPFTAPHIADELFDCERYIPLTGAHPGATLQAFDTGTGQPISDAHVATAPDPAIPLWFPLTAGHKVLVRQRGCNADGDSDEAPVNPLPNPLPTPTVMQPVRPHANQIRVTSVIPGARLHLLVNNVLRPGSLDSLTSEAAILVRGEPLTEDDQIFVIQTLCDQTSALEGHGVPVRRGNLTVSVSPNPINRGTTSSITVTARDADTGDLVNAQVILNNKPVGTTGIPFNYTPTTGDPNPTGIVHEPNAYNDQQFTITLTDPAWMLYMQVGIGPAYLGTARIDVTDISWIVTPDWDTSLTRTIKQSNPPPPSAIGQTTLPIPPGAEKNVTVTVSGTATTTGGKFNNMNVEPQSVSLIGDTRKVTFHGPNERIGWYCQVGYLHNGAAGVFDVTVLFAGINDI